MQTTQAFTTHLDAPELKVYSDAAHKLIVVQACGTVPSAVYRQGLTLATAIAIEKQFWFWLVSNKEGGVITPEDQIWATEVNAPQIARESAIRKMAFVEPKDLHSKIIIEDMMDKVRDIFPFEMQFFEDVPSARGWFMDTEATAFITAVPSQTMAAGRILNS